MLNIMVIIFYPLALIFYNYTSMMYFMQYIFFDDRKTLVFSMFSIVQNCISLSFFIIIFFILYTELEETLVKNL